MAIVQTAVKLGLDNKDFIKGMRESDKAINAVVRDVSTLEKGLNYKWDEKRFVRAQELAQKALEETERKASKIREELKKFEESGAIDTTGYKNLQNELIKVENQALLAQKKIEDFNRLKLDKLTKSVQNLGEGISKAGKSLLGISAAAGGALYGAQRLAKSAVDTGAEIEKLSEQYSLNSKEIQRWQYVALQTNVPAEKLLQSASKIRKAFGEQIAGEMSSATKALEGLKINLGNFKSSEEAFEGVLTAISNIKDETIQAYYANEIFGDKMATDLLPLFKQGESAIRAYTSEFEDIGYLTDDNIKKMAEIQNSINKVNKEFEQAKLKLGMALVPILETFADILTNVVIPAVERFTEWFSNLSPFMQNFIIYGLGIIAILAPLLIILGKVIGAVGEIIKIAPYLGKAIEMLGSSAGRAAIGMAAIGYAVKLLFDVMNAWGDMNTFQKIISVLGILTIVALGAAIAVGAFHSAWSLGLAVAGIVAGIIAVTAAVNSAKDSVEGLDIPDFSAPSVTGGNNSGSYNVPDVNVPTYGSGGYYNDASTSYGDTNFYITMNAAGDLNYDVEEFISQVNQRFRDKKLAYG